jgi:hypothetical protein
LQIARKRLMSSSGFEGVVEFGFRDMAEREWVAVGVKDVVGGHWAED